MSRKRKPLPVIEGLEISALASEGNALGRHGDMVVFVPFGAPGDIVDVKLEKERTSRYAAVVGGNIFPTKCSLRANVSRL